MLSARVQYQEIQEGYQAGADAYITKPFTNQQVLDAVHRLLGERTKD